MRIISRLDIKNNNLIKSIKFDGVRKIGDPKIFAKKYYEKKLDEIFLINNTGSLYNTKLDVALIREIRSIVSIPIASGGGITSVNDSEYLIKSGSEKIVINSLIHTNLSEFKKIISLLGSSSVVGSIQYSSEKKYLTYYKMGRELTGYNLIDTIKFYQDIGCGEILITDICRDGKYTGLDKALYDILNKFYDISILIGGGFKNLNEIDYFKDVASAIVSSSTLHFNKIDLKNIYDVKKIL